MWLGRRVARVPPSATLVRGKEVFGPMHLSALQTAQMLEEMVQDNTGGDAKPGDFRELARWATRLLAAARHANLSGPPVERLKKALEAARTRL